MEESARRYGDPLYSAGARSGGCRDCLWRARRKSGQQRSKRILAFDGKALNGSFDAFDDVKARQMLSAFAVETAPAFTHTEIDEKTNGIPAVPKLLEERDVAGKIVTFDTMHCQKKTGSPVERSYPAKARTLARDHPDGG